MSHYGQGATGPVHHGASSSVMNEGKSGYPYFGQFGGFEMGRVH